MRSLLKSDLTVGHLLAALAAGVIALVPNELGLQAADLFGLAIAHGGLLMVVRMLAGKAFGLIGLSALWMNTVLPETVGNPFQIFFHVMVGVAMAIFYAICVDPNLRMGGLLKGFWYGVIVWLLNALVVLPASGEGVAGLNTISAVGAIWFAGAHFAFFLTLGWSFDRLARGRSL